MSMQDPQGETPPRTRHESNAGQVSFDKIEIMAMMRILNMIEIDHKNSIFFLVFRLSLAWQDEHLVFHFLKKDKTMNTITKSDEAKMWKPKISFLMLDTDEDIIVEENFIIERRGKPVLSHGYDHLHNNETYVGKENLLHLDIINKAKFICSFDMMEFYPFGSQFCSLQVFISGPDNNLTKLSSKNLTDKGSHSVGEYIVKQWTVEEVFMN